jgi:hypothetical protein
MILKLQHAYHVIQILLLISKNVIPLLTLKLTITACIIYQQNFAIIFFEQ